MSKIIGLIGAIETGQNLQKAVENQAIILTADGIDGLSNIRATDVLEAIVVQIRSTDDWMLMEFLSTTHPTIPRFALFEAATSIEDDVRLRDLATKYETAAIFPASADMAHVAGIVTGAFSQNGNIPKLTSKEEYVAELGATWEELQRLTDEYMTTMMRTLPQPEVAADSLERLAQVRELLQNIHINP